METPHRPNQSNLSRNSRPCEDEINRTRPTLENQGVRLLLLVGRRSKDMRACDVGRAIQVLCTGIEQVETLACDLRSRLCLRTVMNDSRIRSKGGDGIETQRLEEVLFALKSLELFSRLRFVDRKVTIELIFEPN